MPCVQTLFTVRKNRLHCHCLGEHHAPLNDSHFSKQNNHFMHYLLYPIFLFLCAHSMAQSAPQPLHDLQASGLDHRFEVGTQTHLLADRVNIRTAPSVDAAVIANLPIGTPVRVVAIARSMP